MVNERGGGGMDSTGRMPVLSQQEAHTPATATVPMARRPEAAHRKEAVVTPGLVVVYLAGQLWLLTTGATTAHPHPSLL